MLLPPCKGWKQFYSKPQNVHLLPNTWHCWYLGSPVQAIVILPPCWRTLIWANGSVGVKWFILSARMKWNRGQFFCYVPVARPCWIRVCVCLFCFHLWSSSHRWTRVQEDEWLPTGSHFIIHRSSLFFGEEKLRIWDCFPNHPSSPSERKRLRPALREMRCTLYLHALAMSGLDFVPFLLFHTAKDCPFCRRREGNIASSEAPSASFC